MRLNINLASQKYEDVRQFYVRWSATLALLLALTTLLAILTALHHSRSVKSGQQIKELEQKVSALQRERDQDIAFENRPENRDVTEQKKFWNAQIALRRMSWTQLFNDLQKMMPGRAFLNSVHPELSRDGRLKLALIITGEKSKDARELVENMEKSKRFNSSIIRSENLQKETKPGLPPVYKFDIETFYTPASEAAPLETKGGAL